MNQILEIAKYTIKQNIRNRVYYVLLIFAFILVFVSMLFSVLGGEQPIRILLDFGLSTIEFIALLTMIFSGVSLLVEEIDSKSIYFVLVRPIPKWFYVLGRYLGLLFAVYLSMILMYVFHCLILFYKGWQFELNYLTAAISSMLKIAIVGSLSVFFSLFSTSQAAALVFTFFIWLIGHFGSEIKFLINKIQVIPIKIIMKVIYFLIPNLQYFNWKEFLDAGLSIYNWLPLAFLYGVVYSAVCISFGVVLFNRKEF